MTPRLLAAALVVAVAACSSGDETAPATTDTPGGTGVTTTAPATTQPATGIEPAATTSPASQPTTEPSPESTDAPSTTPDDTADPNLTDAERAGQELARSALITLDSFPDGWIEEPESDDDSLADTEFEAQFDACVGRDDDERAGDELEELAVSTGDFRPAGDGATSVRHEVVLASDEATAVTAMAEVSVDGAESCIADVVQRFYQKTLSDEPGLEGITIGEVTVTRTERERPPDIATGVLVEVPLTLETDTVVQYLEILHQREGRALSELSFVSFGSPFSRDGYTALSTEAAAGLARIGN